MILRQADPSEFASLRDFYWQVIDLMSDRTDTVGWKKGIYPSDDMIMEGLLKGEFYVLGEAACLKAAVRYNSSWNEGYEGLPWSIGCPRNAVYVPHALAVHPLLQGQGIGKKVVSDLIALAREEGKMTIRLDLLAGNQAAKALYTGMGFTFVASKTMYYEDTGWTEFLIYEYLL